MIPALRQRFNAAFTETRYAAFLDELNTAVYWPVDFRVAESPLFLDEPTTQELIRAADDILRQLATPAFRAHARTAIPVGLAVPAETPWPHFLAVDFALCHDADGHVQPQLIELQGFPTVACWQALLTRTYQKHFPEIPADFTSYFGGLDEAGYLAALRRAKVPHSLQILMLGRILGDVVAAASDNVHNTSGQVGRVEHLRSFDVRHK